MSQEQINVDPKNVKIDEDGNILISSASEKDLETIKEIIKKAEGTNDAKIKIMCGCLNFGC